VGGEKTTVATTHKLLQREPSSVKFLGGWLTVTHSVERAAGHGTVRCVYLRKAAILTLHPLLSQRASNGEIGFSCPKMLPQNVTPLRLSGVSEVMR
jgi:hypothetical protein